MMEYKPSNMKSDLLNGSLDERLAIVYGNDPSVLRAQAERYAGAIDDFVATFGHENDPILILSAPGRTEIGGNHTDHQHGRVLAASVNLDVIAIVAKTDTGVIRVQSRGFASMDVAEIADLAPKEHERNHSASICRGIAARFAQLGYAIGGFDAYTTSDVLKGSGLSSSAAFEVLLGVILNQAYNDGKIDAVTIAQIGQYAENHYFGKPCGLMDQTASSVGSFVTIDFNDPSAPIVEQIDFDFAASGYALCIIDSAGNHADLTADYAAIPSEMKSVAAFFGKDVLREVCADTFYENLRALRQAGVSDRAILRAMHFLADNQRVAAQAEALRRGDFQAFLGMVIDSGHSSYMYNQNVYSPAHPEEQGIAVALALAERLLKDRGGAWRVHGGGFAGTIQTFIPVDSVALCKAQFEQAFGAGCFHRLAIRSVGGVCVLQ